MAEEKSDLRDVNFRQLLPWTELFRGFQVALDPKKLLLAAAGILVMAFGWWLLAVIFFSSRTEPTWNAGTYNDWSEFEKDRRKWNLLNDAAGDKPTFFDANDLAQDSDQFTKIQADIIEGRIVPQRKPYGKMRTWPWYEDRGPNPYLLVTGQAGGADGAVPWEKGRFWDWLLTRQFPVLVEPLVKFLTPVIYLLHPSAGFWNRTYFTLVLLWTLATWALFGGAITRMAAVQVARKEKISMAEAIKFSLARYVSFFSAPLFPLLFVLGIVLLLILFGFIHWIPWLGDLWDGLLWPLVILAGLVMAVVLVGLVGWPMMYATISAEGSDSFDALSRSYSYVYQSPWHYLWYCVVALAYGAAVVFFVGFMGSLTVYLGKWGVGQNPVLERADREPEYLFIWAPTSFGWRDLLLHGNPKAVDSKYEMRPAYKSSYTAMNYVGASLVTVWLWIIFLMVVGFGYSYFWSASTIIYLLMRRKVDDTDLDEIYLEEDETEEPYSTSAPAPPPAPPATGGGSLTMVESPSLRTSAPVMPAPTPPSARPESKAADAGDIPPGVGPAP